jgi:hypothetical protein
MAPPATTARRVATRSWQGNSREDIDALLADHPHLKLPGSSIDVFEALPLPGM